MEGEKSEINRDQLVAFLDPFTLSVALSWNLSPFPGYFCGAKYCSKALSFLWNAHCMIAVILLLLYFQTSILDVFADTNWSNLKGNFYK